MPAIDSQAIESRNPRGIVAAHGRSGLHILWIADRLDEDIDDANERPEILQILPPGEESPRALGEPARALGVPLLVSEGDSTLCLTPRLVEECWQLESRLLEEGTGAQLSRFPSSVLPGRGSLVAGDDGFYAVYEVWSHRGPRALVFRVSRRGSLSVLEDEIPGDAWVRSPRLCASPARPWLVWLQSRSRGRSWSVCLKKLGENRVRRVATQVRRGRIEGLDALAQDDGHLWLAWHTNSGRGRRPDLTRWVEVVAIRGEKVLNTRGRPLDRRWGVLGEDQGLEFPSLIPQANRSVALIARSSHRFWHSSLGQEGWSPLEPIDDEGWDCRPRRVAVAPLGEGRAALAWRRRHHVRFCIFELDETKPPRLESRVPSADISHRPRRARGRAHSFSGEWEILFGDIHQHTAHSDGTGSLHEAYERAREEYGDDFVAVTDHESFLGKRIGPGEWLRSMAECDRYNEPGCFVTIPGYEWTGVRHPGPGHKCVYWPSTDRPLLGREHPEARDSKSLVAAVGARGGLVFPHHVGWTGADAEAHEPSVQTCWEVVSCHGSYEYFGEKAIGQRDVPLEGQFIRDQLDHGLRFGFVGGSDGHGLLWHHGVSRKRDSHRTGLTALLVRERSREALFEALRLRRCYATSGVPIFIELSADGTPMGACRRWDGGTIHLDIRVEADQTLDAATLICARGFEHELEVNGSKLTRSFEFRFPQGPHAQYLYLRIALKDGEFAWTSPIWFDA